MADRMARGAPSADVLASAIVAQAEEEAAKTRESAKVEAERIVAQAEAEALESRAGASREEMERVRKETATELALARFDARRRFLNAREELIEAVFADASKGLEELRKGDSYSHLLTDLAREAFDSLDGDSFLVLVAPEDKATVERVLNDAGRVEIAADPDVRGGCVVWQKDRRAYYDNSFTAIVERERPLLRPLVAEWLLGAEQQWRKS